ncbi:hypothetical protein, partial [Chamaesiphon polymorphus]|uniref:hypothetical protein n=1 Tax=Chamaesiphon polymorphus TaxID=2107691 RepID=UPI0015E6E5C8
LSIRIITATYPFWRSVVQTVTLTGVSYSLKVGTKPPSLPPTIYVSPNALTISKYSDRISQYLDRLRYFDRELIIWLVVLVRYSSTIF